MAYPVYKIKKLSHGTKEGEKEYNYNYNNSLMTVRISIGQSVIQTG